MTAIRRTGSPVRTLAVLCTASALAAVAAAAPAPVTLQLTSSGEDSSLARIGVAPRNRWLALRSTGDLTPGQPGNADLSAEIWRADLFVGGLVQATDSLGGVSCPRVSLDGDLVLASREDLTPGDPGNADGSFEAWIFDGPGRVLTQVTASDEDSFFQTFTDLRRTAYFVSKGDLVPGDPGNTDRSNEVYELDVASGRLRQLTASPADTVIRGVTIEQHAGILESGGELVPGGNPDGSREVFLVNLDTRQIRQLTFSAAESRFVGRDDSGRWLAIESTGDLVFGGNPDGSREVFLWDFHDGTLRQVTSSPGDSSFAAFLPRSPLIAVHSRVDLVAGGNGDGSQEVFLVNARRGGIRQLTATAGDTTLLSVGTGARRWAVLRSSGDLSTGAATPTRDLWVQKILRRKTRATRLTSGDDAAGFGGFAARDRRIVLDTTTDLVPGGNTDGSREVYVVRLGRRIRTVQATASPAADSRAAATSAAWPVAVIESRADLVPGGNADGSLEVFSYRFGPVPKKLLPRGTK